MCFPAFTKTPKKISSFVPSAKGEKEDLSHEGGKERRPCKSGLLTRSMLALR